MISGRARRPVLKGFETWGPAELGNLVPRTGFLPRQFPRNLLVGDANATPPTLPRNRADAPVKGRDDDSLAIYSRNSLRCAQMPELKLEC